MSKDYVWEQYDPVAIRRVRDDKYLVGAKFGAEWGSAPRFLKSETAARSIIRIELGGDIDDYEIVRKAELEP